MPRETPHVPDEGDRGQHEHAGVGMATLEVERHDRDRRCGVRPKLRIWISGFTPISRICSATRKPVLVVRNDIGHGAVETCTRSTGSEAGSVGKPGQNCFGKPP